VGWHFDIGNAGRVGPAERWIQMIGKRINRISHQGLQCEACGPGSQRPNTRPKLLDGDTNWPRSDEGLWTISATPAGQIPSNRATRARTSKQGVTVAQRMDRIFWV
jgi:hypothetical protein